MGWRNLTPDDDRAMLQRNAPTRARPRLGTRVSSRATLQAALLAITAACGGASSTPPAASPAVIGTPTTPTTPTATTPSNVLDARVDAGGLALHIHCEGAGTPAVVFDSGLGLDGSGWFGTESEVGLAAARVTRACAYDRASRGQSDPPAAFPHSNRQMARELFALLQNAGEHGPFVLVGHSMGGTNIQLFLAEHPDSVAGMVLIDASPEPPPIDRVPPNERVQFEDNLQALEGLDVPTLLAGFKDLEASGRTLGDKPLVVLVAGRVPEGTPAEIMTQARAELAARQASQQRLTQLSTNSLLLVIKDAGHHIPHDNPTVVARAVTAVIQAARNNTRLDPTTIRPTPTDG